VTPARKPSERRHWYTISVDSLRGWGIFFVLVALAVGGWVGYQRLRRVLAEREVAAIMAESGAMLERLQSERGVGDFHREYDAAWRSFEQARQLQAQDDVEGALASARRTRALVSSVLDSLRHRGEAGEAQFISVQGAVEFRRGEAGEWEEARARVSLRSGDYVKSSPGGSAEIMFVDGTLYTVRPNTLFLVARQQNPRGAIEQSIRMEYGWVNLNTARRGSRVETPAAEARVAQESEASVTYDRGTASGRYTSFRGALEVAAPGGATRQVGELQQVTQTGSQISEPRRLPGSPAILEPAENAEINLDRIKELALTWTPVAGAVRYALQVSRNRLFVDNVIDVDNRSATRATLGLRGEGTFLWRVASFGRDGLQGPWSAPRQFRVASLRGGADASDKTPPALDLEEIRSYGNIFIVAGKTEPGATVEVNGEAVTVETDGAFTKTVQVAADGWSFVEVRAVDAWGNQTTRRRRVFVENL
jgi:hypothetical protein